MIPGWFKKSNISQKLARREVCFLEKKGSLAGKLASKKYDIIIAQALSKLRECIDVLKKSSYGFRIRINLR